MKKGQRKHFTRRVGAVGAALMLLVGIGIVPTQAKSNSGVVLDIGSAEYETDKSVAVIKTTSQSLNTVRDSIFGANTSWIDDGYGMWDSQNDAPYGIMLNKVKASGVKHIRYPGGIEGDYFHFAETLGNLSQRKPQINCFSSEYPTYDAYDGVKYPVTFGVDELFRFCKSAGIKTTIQLNAGNGTPKEAADYINYIISKGNQKYVDSFCVGNEVCMSAERVDDVPITRNPNSYIDFCQSFFKKIGSKITHDKNTTIGVIGITPSHPLCAYKNWDIKVLDALADKIDFIDVHIGYSYYSQGNADRKTSAKCFMASSKWIKSMIEEEKSLIYKYAKDDADHIGIQISELGPNGGEYVCSVAGAVFLADLYNVILAEPQVTATDYLPLLNHYASAQLIGAMTYAGAGEDEYYWDNAVSYVFKMYSDLVGKSVLETKVSGCGKFNAEACGLVPAISNVDNSSVAVYYDEKSGTGSMFLINRSLDKNEKFNISLPTSNAKITGVTELWNKDCMASNSYSNPRAVTLKTYSNYSKANFGELSATIKPVSLVRIDFSSKDISVVKPTVVIVNSTGKKATATSDSDKNIGENKRGGKAEQSTEISGDGEDDPVDTTADHSVSKRSSISTVVKKIIKAVDYTKAMKILMKITVVWLAVMLLEAIGAGIFIIFWKRKDRCK